MKRRRLATNKRLAHIQHIQFNARKRVARYLIARSRQARSLLENVVFLWWRSRPAVPRAVWCKPKSSTWWENIVEKTFKDCDWRKNFRMGERTFKFLCEEVHRYLYRESTHMREAVSVRRRVAIALWRLATNADYRTIAHLPKMCYCSIVGISS